MQILISVPDILKNQSLRRKIMSAIISKEDLKHEIEELDENYLELVLRLLKQFSHRPKAKLQDSSQEKNSPAWI